MPLNYTLEMTDSKFYVSSVFKVTILIDSSNFLSLNVFVYVLEKGPGQN